jgi:hypothetical protein
MNFQGRSRTIVRDFLFLIKGQRSTVHSPMIIFKPANLYTCKPSNFQTIGLSNFQSISDKAREFPHIIQCLLCKIAGFFRGLGDDPVNFSGISS